ncbi:MAG: YbaY family lipoprotein [Chloroflexota bacterium]
MKQDTVFNWRKLVLVPVLLLVLALAACSGTTTDDSTGTDAGITGTVTYLQRSALAPGSVITVQLQDVSLADAPATTLGEQVITTTDEQVPVPYEVGYTSADIQDNHTYAVRATITDSAGTLLFTSDTHIPVITNGSPTEDVEIVVVPVP